MWLYFLYRCKCYGLEPFNAYIELELASSRTHCSGQSIVKSKTRDKYGTSVAVYISKQARQKLMSSLPIQEEY